MSDNVAPPTIPKDKRSLVVSFIQFLRQEVSTNQFPAEQIEGVDLSIQCLETVFALTDKDYAFQPSKPLLEIFKDVEDKCEFAVPSESDVEQANKLKEEGNELFKNGTFQEAIQKYNQAIKMNRDPIYFCNRAAVYCRLEQNDLAIQDCRTALALDPNYAKAYGRLGVALFAQNRHEQAVEAYKKAVELDPSNESYKSNLTVAEDKLRETQQRTGGENLTPGFGGIGNLGGMFNNPHMVQMAAQMMSDPSLQNMMGQMMGAFSGQGAGQENGGGLENLMRVGEQVAEVLSAQNPGLVEQLRQQFGSRRSNENDEDAP